MKFYTLLLAITTVSAIKLQASSSVELQKEEKFIEHSMVSLAADILVEHSEAEWIAWLREEAASDDGLTWDELKAKLTEVAAEHNYTPTPKDWKKIRRLFDHVDKDHNGSISPSELEAALNGHDH